MWNYLLESKIIFIRFYILVIIIEIEDGFMRRLETKLFFFSQYEKKEQSIAVFHDETYDAALRVLTMIHILT